MTQSPPIDTRRDTRDSSWLAAGHAQARTHPKANSIRRLPSRECAGCAARLASSATCDDRAPDAGLADDILVDKISPNRLSRDDHHIPLVARRVALHNVAAQIHLAVRSNA